MKSKKQRFRNMKKSIIPALLLIVFIIGCGDENKCSSICTEEFKSIHLTIKDANGNSIVLDQFTVTLTDSNKDITEDLDFDQTFAGTYPIIDDSFTSEAKSNDLKVQFIGKIDDTIVVEENYIIGSDCCHILLISGETEITI